MYLQFLTDFNIRLLQERKLIPLGVKDVSYELTLNDRILNDNKRMLDMKNFLQEAFQKMIDGVKKDLQPGDIMRGAIYNNHLDLPIYTPVGKWRI